MVSYLYSNRKMPITKYEYLHFFKTRRTYTPGVAPILILQHADVGASVCSQHYRSYLPVDTDGILSSLGNASRLLASTAAATIADDLPKNLTVLRFLQ